MSLKALLSNSKSLAWELLRGQWLRLGLLFAIGTLLNIYVEDSLASLPRGQEDSRWLYQLALGLWDLFEGLAALLILSAGIANVRQLSSPPFLSKPFSEPYLGSFLAEYLRVLAQVLLWGLLLIIPGFVRYCRLIFVPLITLFSKEYREGKADALDLAQRLSQGRMKLIVPTIVITTTMQMGMELLPNIVPNLHTLVFRVGFGLAAFLVGLWTYSFLYLIFEDSLNRLNS